MIATYNLDSSFDLSAIQELTFEELDFVNGGQFSWHEFGETVGRGALAGGISGGVVGGIFGPGIVAGALAGAVGGGIYNGVDYVIIHYNQK